MYGASNNTLGIYQFTLDRLTIKSSRSVYNFIDYLAEIGGFYGLLTIGAQMLIKLLNTHKLYIVSLIKHMEPVFPQDNSYIKKHSLLFRPLLTKLKSKNDQVFKIEEDDFIIMMRHMRQYFKFKVSLLTRIVACYLPHRFHS